MIDALIADAKTKTAAAVKDGKITQEQADERLDALTERVTSFVQEGFRWDRDHDGGDHPAPPADGEAPADGETPSFGGGTGGN